MIIFKNLPRLCVLAGIGFLLANLLACAKHGTPANWKSDSRLKAMCNSSRAFNVNKFIQDRNEKMTKSTVNNESFLALRTYKIKTVTTSNNKKIKDINEMTRDLNLMASVKNSQDINVPASLTDTLEVTKNCSDLTAQVSTPGLGKFIAQGKITSISEKSISIEEENFQNKEKVKVSIEQDLSDQFKTSAALGISRLNVTIERTKDGQTSTDVIALNTDLISADNDIEVHSSVIALAASVIQARASGVSRLAFPLIVKSMAKMTKGKGSGIMMSTDKTGFRAIDSYNEAIRTGKSSIKIKFSDLLALRQAVESYLVTMSVINQYGPARESPY